jgi:hypothetical protein
MSDRKNFPAVRLLPALLAACASCTGTPTSEPPDFLPRPDGARITTDVVVVSSPQNDAGFAGNPGAVSPNTDVWVVNLDDESVKPVTYHAGADGAFQAGATGNPQDRIRIVSRSKDRHSPALDFKLIQPNGMFGLSLLPDTSLACLHVLPRFELDFASSGELGFTLENTCGETLTITRAALRFGDQGFTLKQPAASIAAGKKLDIDVSYAGSTARQEADILLLDVKVATKQGRYALGVWLE